MVKAQARLLLWLLIQKVCSTGWLSDQKSERLLCPLWFRSSWWTKTLTNGHLRRLWGHWTRWRMSVFPQCPCLKERCGTDLPVPPTPLSHTHTHTHPYRPTHPHTQPPLASQQQQQQQHLVVCMSMAASLENTHYTGKAPVQRVWSSVNIKHHTLNSKWLRWDEKNIILLMTAGSVNDFMVKFWEMMERGGDLLICYGIHIIKSEAS